VAWSWILLVRKRGQGQFGVQAESLFSEGVRNTVFSRLGCLRFAKYATILCFLSYCTTTSRLTPKLGPLLLEKDRSGIWYCRGEGVNALGLTMDTLLPLPMPVVCGLRVEARL